MQYESGGVFRHADPSAPRDENSTV
eukprot:COSAG01_NODE_3375_length_6177_cov_6.183119_2_plen_24_part_01